MAVAGGQQSVTKPLYNRLPKTDHRPQIPMSLFSAADRDFVAAVSQLSYCNPFLPERIELESAALGDAFDHTAPVWSRRLESPGQRANIQRLSRRAGEVADAVRSALTDGVTATAGELREYEDLICYLLYYRHWRNLDDPAEADSELRVPDWPPFLAGFNHYLSLPGVELPTGHDPGHLFACFYQIRRAFHYIFDFLLGGSLPAAQLRASVWQSIFTHNMRRYRRTLFQRMADITTLVMGPSGSGKEVVAKAIGASRYIPFDVAAEKFTVDCEKLFYALNLSALAPTVIESELFGHCRGAFTGAVSDRVGWLEACDALGTVFLDEIGELDAGIQVKLLRMLQTRTFQRLGETQDRKFAGKIVAATNRDLSEEMRAGRFREDFYYRLCSDMITTPSLYEQIIESSEDLRNLVSFISARESGDEAEEVTAEVMDWIEGNLGPDYRWPGNIRELEQCVRNVMVRKQYRPPRADQPREVGGLPQQLAAAMREGKLTADELVRYYCTLVYAETGSYEATAKRLNLDRRTVKSKVDEQLLAKLGMK